MDGDLLITVIIAAVVIGAGGFIMADLGANGSGSDQTIRTIETSHDIRDGAADMPDPWFGGLKTVDPSQSLGTSAELTGASDSELRGDLGADRGPQWSVSVWVEADQLRTQRGVQVGGWLYIDLVDNGGTGEYEITYYDETTLQVYDVTVAAPNATSMTNVVVAENGTHLNVYRNTTDVANLELATAGGASIPDRANWDGRIEEFRQFDGAINSSIRQTLYDTPTAPTDGDEVARAYFDARSSNPDSVPVYWSDGSLALSNATIVDGFEGQSVTEGDDITINLANHELRVVEGGALDGAPVLFADYTVAGGAGVFAMQFVNATAEIVTILTTMILVVVIGYLKLMRD